MPVLYFEGDGIMIPVPSVPQEIKGWGSHVDGTGQSISLVPSRMRKLSVRSFRYVRIRLSPRRHEGSPVEARGSPSIPSPYGKISR